MNAFVYQEIKPVFGEQFISALGAQAFDQLQAIFGPQTRFRALVPSRLCEGSTAGEAVSWLRRWFGHADQVQGADLASTNRVFDRLHMSYRLRVHDVINGWRVIERRESIVPACRTARLRIYGWCVPDTVQIIKI